MPTSVDKTASNIHRRNAQYPCDFAVAISAVEKSLGFVEVKRDGTPWLSSVHVLLAACCPAAITRRITEIIIDAVKRQAFRALPISVRKLLKSRHCSQTLIPRPP